MAKLLYWNLLFLFLSTSNGCFLQEATVEIHLANATHSTIATNLKEGGIVLRPGEAVNVGGAGVGSTFYIISTDGSKAYFNIGYPDIEYSQFRSSCTPSLFDVHRDKIRFQLEPNGCIYVIQSSGAFPCESPPGQPAGFPLRPRRE